MTDIHTTVTYCHWNPIFDHVWQACWSNEFINMCKSSRISSQKRRFQICIQKQQFPKPVLFIISLVSQKVKLNYQFLCHQSQFVDWEDDTFIKINKWWVYLNLLCSPTIPYESLFVWVCSHTHMEIQLFWDITQYQLIFKAQIQNIWSKMDEGKKFIWIKSFKISTHFVSCVIHELNGRNIFKSSWPLLLWRLSV